MRWKATARFFDELGPRPKQTVPRRTPHYAIAIACFLFGEICRPPPHVAGMVWDNVGKVDKYSLATPVILVEVDSHEASEVEEVEL